MSSVTESQMGAIVIYLKQRAVVVIIGMFTI